MSRNRPALLAAVVACCLTLLALPAAGTTAEAGWHRVAFEDRVRAGDVAALVEAGSVAHQYVPHDAFVAWLEAGDVADVAALDGVVEIRPLTVAEKVGPLQGRDGPPRLALEVYGAEVPAVRAHVAAQGWSVVGSQQAASDGSVMDLYVAAPPAAAAALADIPAVRFIGPAPGLPVPEDEMSNQIIAGFGPSGGSLEPGYEEFLATAGVDGSGVRVSIVDSGIDPLHPDFGDRIVGKAEYSEVAEPLDVGGHGTHVAGIVGANATDLPGIGRVRDEDGFLYGLGVAPGVELVDQNALAITGGGVLCGVNWPPPYEWNRLSEDALDHGASISNSSWHSCEGTGSGYIASVRTFDILSRNADWRTDDVGEPFTFVFSAGNSGQGSGDETRLTAPKEAKNIITVASSINARSGDPETIAGSSSRGPTVDGRVAPTVAAPGQGIVSTRSQTGALCATPVTDGFGLYASCSGTSMAAPHVAGAVALLTDWWRETNDGADPSPAMAKALLVNTARTLLRTPPIPNRDEGWGRIDLGALFDPDIERVYVDQEVSFDDRDQSWTLRVQPADPALPLRITLTWSDAPGAVGSDPAIVNDLDLVVTAEDGTTYRGNVLEDSWSMAGGSPDRLNNVENVFLLEPDGEYVITVTAHNLPANAIPFSGRDVDQDFALVVSNAVAVTG